MKAIIEKGIVYKIVDTRGDYTIVVDVKGKGKMFATRDIEIVDAEFEKVKVYAKAKASQSNSQYISEMKKDLNDAKYSTGRYTNQ